MAISSPDMSTELFLAVIKVFYAGGLLESDFGFCCCAFVAAGALLCLGVLLQASNVILYDSPGRQHK